MATITCTCPCGKHDARCLRCQAFHAFTARVYRDLTAEAKALGEHIEKFPTLSPELTMLRREMLQLRGRLQRLTGEPATATGTREAPVVMPRSAAARNQDIADDPAQPFNYDAP